MTNTLSFVIANPALAGGSNLYPIILGLDHLAEFILNDLPTERVAQPKHCHFSVVPLCGTTEKSYDNVT
jgi:hypothetical protein